MGMFKIADGAENHEKVFDELISKLREYFVKNKINEFLDTHVKLSQLYTRKLQWEIDREPKQDIREVRFDINPEAIKVLENLTNKIDKLNLVPEQQTIPEVKTEIKQEDKTNVQTPVDIAK